MNNDEPPDYVKKDNPVFEYDLGTRLSETFTSQLPIEKSINGNNHHPSLATEQEASEYLERYRTS